MPFDYGRFLAAKTTVDDRALNRQVLAELCRLMPGGALRVLEVGAGLGTMVARLMDWGAVLGGRRVHFYLLDVDPATAGLFFAGGCAIGRPRRRACAATCLPDGLRVRAISRCGVPGARRARQLPAGRSPGASADRLLIANAVLDLVDDAGMVLPGLLRLLIPGGVYWFTINYDGESIFAPDHPHDDQIMRAYHRDMDERFRYGGPPGESRTGRRLFHYLRAVEAPAPMAVRGRRTGS